MFGTGHLPTLPTEVHGPLKTRRKLEPRSETSSRTFCLRANSALATGARSREKEYQEYHPTALMLSEQRVAKGFRDGVHVQASLTPCWPCVAVSASVESIATSY
jgi:hypothetical protein